MRHEPAVALLACGALALLTACPAAPEVPANKPGRYLSVTLKRAGGATTLVSQDELTLPAAPPAFPGEELVVGWLDGGVKTVAFVTFDPMVRGEVYDGSDEVGEAVEELTDEAVATVTLDATEVLDKVTLVRPDGAVLLELSPQFATESRGLKQGLRANEFETPLARAPGLKFLTPAGVHALPGGLRSKLSRAVAFSELSAVDQAKVRAAFDGPSERTLAALSMVALGDFQPSDTAHGWANGNSAVFRLSALTAATGDGGTPDPLDAVRAKKVVAHEAAHVVMYLLDAAASPRTTGWPPQVAEPARARVDADLLGLRLSEVWAQAHASAVAQSLAQDYSGAGWQTAFADRQAVLAAGFATSYGSGNPKEDIAEYVAQVQVTYGSTTDPRYRTVCEHLQSQASAPATASLVPYFKLQLLRRMGFFEEAKFTACLGAYALPNTGSGLHFMTSLQTTSKSFPGQMVGGTKLQGAARQLVVAGNAADDTRVALVLRAPEGRSIVGVYALDPANPDDVTANAFFYAHPTNLAANRMSGGGLVVVTRADASGIEGAGVMVNLQSDIATTDVFPWVPFKYP